MAIQPIKGFLFLLVVTIGIITPGRPEKIGMSSFKSHVTASGHGRQDYRASTERVNISPIWPDRNVEPRHSSRLH